MCSRVHAGRGSSAREAGEGSGLGLAIARRIVGAAGGTITAERGGARRGLRVVAHLALLDAAAGGTHAALEPDDHLGS